MNTDQILKVLKNERECILSNHDNCYEKCNEFCPYYVSGVEKMEVLDFLINGYELMQKQGAEKYVLRCDTSKLSEAEKTRLRELIENERFAAPTLTAQIKPLPPDIIATLLGKEG